MEEEQITTEEQSRRNKEFGRSIADIIWEAGMTRCPWVLNSEQAEALQERWKELQKQRKAMQQKTANYVSKKKRKRK